MPGLVDCHFNLPLYFRAGTTVTTFFDILVNTLVPGELMFRNVTYAREVSTEVVVCMLGVYNKHSWLFTVLLQSTWAMLETLCERCVWYSPLTLLTPVVAISHVLVTLFIDYTMYIINKVCIYINFTMDWERSQVCCHTVMSAIGMSDYTATDEWCFSVKYLSCNYYHW